MDASGNHTGQRLTDKTDRSSVGLLPTGGDVTWSPLPAPTIEDAAASQATDPVPDDVAHERGDPGQDEDEDEAQVGRSRLLRRPRAAPASRGLATRSGLRTPSRRPPGSRSGRARRRGRSWTSGANGRRHAGRRALRPPRGPHASGPRAAGTRHWLRAGALAAGQGPRRAALGHAAGPARERIAPAHGEHPRSGQCPSAGIPGRFQPPLRAAAPRLDTALAQLAAAFPVLPARPHPWRRAYNPRLAIKADLLGPRLQP